MRWGRRGLVGNSSLEGGGPTAALRLAEASLAETEYFVIDIETSGFHAQRDLVLSLAAALWNARLGVMTEDFYSLVRHDDVSIVPDEVWNLTGLTKESIQNGRPWPEILEQALKMANQRVWIAHHARHELTFLQRHARSLWKLTLHPLVIDTGLVAAALTPSLGIPTLEAACEQFQIPVLQRHRADMDVQMTIQLWQAEMKMCQRLGLQSVKEVIEWSLANALG